MLRIRTGLTKLGLPGASVGMQVEDLTIAGLLKPLGYATGQFGNNHLGDRDEMLTTKNVFDEFYGNLYHLNAKEELGHRDYPKDPGFRKKVWSPWCAARFCKWRDQGHRSNDAKAYGNH